jgi:hypothetical protein
MPKLTHTEATPKQKEFLKRSLAVKLLTLNSPEPFDKFETFVQVSEVPLFKDPERLTHQDHLFKIAYEICGDFRMYRKQSESLTLIFNDLSLLNIDHTETPVRIHLGLVPGEEVEAMKQATTTFLDYLDVKRVLHELLPHIRYLFENHGAKSARTIIAGLLGGVHGLDKGKHTQSIDLAAYFLSAGSEPWPCLNCLEENDQEIADIYGNLSVYTATATSAKH